MHAYIFIHVNAYIFIPVHAYIFIHLHAQHTAGAATPYEGVGGEKNLAKVIYAHTCTPMHTYTYSYM